MLLEAIMPSDGQDPIDVPSLIEQAQAMSEYERDVDNHPGQASADRHLEGILGIYKDEDCLTQEFDVSSEEFDVQHAIEVFQKCRIVVLRNVLDDEAIEDTLPNFTQYIQDVNQGRIRQEGTTSYGGGFFILREDEDRFNYMVPEDLITNAPELFAHPVLIDLLSHPSILGDDMVLNHAGTINAFPNGHEQYWHMDGHYVHNEQNDPPDLGGHDLPPFAINLFTPLLDLTPEHGPTEFCVGTSHWKGLDLDGYDELGDDDSEETSNSSEDDDDDANILRKLLEFEWQALVEAGHGRRTPKCPPPFSRQPLLQRGDVVLFDYMVTHRGGRNKSPDLRSLLFAMYSRKWYRDTTFDGGAFEEDCEGDPQECELEYLTKMTRFAVVERADDDEHEYEHGEGGNDEL